MQDRANEPKHFRDAEQAARQGDREIAYDLMRQVLIDDPTYLPAWLSMSTLVDNIEHELECLERALALDPENKTAREGIERLRLNAMLSSVHAPVFIDRRVDPRQIGAHLIGQGVISVVQLNTILREQRQHRQQGKYIQLGDLLLKQGWITPNTLARILVEQIQENSEQHRGNTPHFLGEYLIGEQVITPMQLETALEEQIWLRLSGQRLALGHLLIRKGYLSKGMLEHILSEQKTAFFNSMGD